MHEPMTGLRRARRLFAAVLATALGFGTMAGAIAFPRADQNGDGKVTYEEARLVYPQLMRMTFKKCANKQGFIDKGHWPCLENIYQLLYRSPD